MSIKARFVVLLVLPMLASVTCPARAATSMGANAFDLAILAATNSPILTAGQKQAFANLAAGNGSGSGSISVTADKIVCLTSPMDLARHQCDLTFGSHTVTLKGAGAIGLTAVLHENGASTSGAAGTAFTALKSLSCTIDEATIGTGDARGATCTFEAQMY